MSWWKRLKGWQKAGIVVGGFHLIMYVTLYLLTSGSMGVLLLYDLELPWLLIVSLVIGDIAWSGTKAELLVIGIIGTVVYSLVGMSITLLMKLLTHENERKS